jgi:nucleotidyltransferase substrate binding protein (TIGR01987 family)
MTDMANKDSRWIQRFSNFNKAFIQLTKFMDRNGLNALEEQGLIQSFEYNHELAWKTQKDFLESRGVSELFGSRDVVREAFNLGLIENGDVWLEMINDRNLTSHTYNEATTQKIISHIVQDYYTEFKLLIEKLEHYHHEIE